MISIPEGTAIKDSPQKNRQTHALPAFKSCVLTIRKRKGHNNKKRGDHPKQRIPASGGLLHRWGCGTDLSVEVHVCNAVQGELVPIRAILVDVSHSQTRQLPHRFVITGHGSKFNGSQRQILAAHADAITGQQEERQ